MDAIDTTALNHRIAEFARRHSDLSPLEAEAGLVDILAPLFEADGYEFTDVGRSPDGTFDYIAYRDLPGDEHPVATCIEYKHYRLPRKISIRDVRGLVAGAVLRQYDRAILLSNTDLSRTAEQELLHTFPVQFQLMNLSSLHAWAYRIEKAQKGDISPIVRGVTELSQLFARQVAENPRHLDEIAWWDIERMLAFVFEQLGFQVELTPSSKDGGKDIILNCFVLGAKRKYLVEVKHWRSGKKVGTQKLKDFVHVVASEQAHSGLYIATYGYSGNAIEALSQAERVKIRCGKEEQIRFLCETFVRAESAIWSPPRYLDELLLHNTM